MEEEKLWWILIYEHDETSIFTLGASRHEKA